MTDHIESRLKLAPVVPLVQSDDPETAIQITHALVAGGLTVIEVVLRTPAAVECLAEVARAVPEAIVGAGTVLNKDQVGEVLKAGAQFIVSPGSHAPVISASLAAGVPVFPGVATATEVQNAWNMGLKVMKFFPASLAGGPPMLKALGSVFRDVSFMPTGGVSVNNLAEYLALPNVIACGGSWLTPAVAIEAGEFSRITGLAAAAIEIAKEVRG